MTSSTRQSAPSLRKDGARTPLELWAFIFGVVAYSAAPLLPWVSVLRFPQVALFAAATAFALIVGRERKAYWGTIVLIGFSMALPFLNQWFFPALYDLTWIDVCWFVLPPALLLGLLVSPRVRRFVAQPSRADEVESTRCNWCNRSDAELEKIVLAARREPFGLAGSSATEYWVHPEHRGAFLARHEQKERHAKHLLIVILATVAGLVLLVPISVSIDGPRLGLAACGSFLVVLGIAYLLLPSGSVSTIRWLGLRRAETVGRWTGAVLVSMGLGAIWIAFRLF